MTANAMTSWCRVRGGVLAAAMLALAACTAGLQPRHLERLEYGMEHRGVAEMLETDVPPLPVLRFFAEDERGGVHDCLVEIYDGARPHPEYAVVAVDGALRAVMPCPPGQVRWWRRAPAAGDREPCAWTPAQLSALMREAGAARVPLDWARLQTIDDEASRQPAPPTERAKAASGGVFWWLFARPAELEPRLRSGDAANSTTIREYLVGVAPRASADEVLAALGAPTREQEVREAGAQRVVHYDFGNGHEHTLGFLDGRLLWIEFGR